MNPPTTEQPKKRPSHFVRDDNGSLRRRFPKIKGKSAVKADRRARRQAHKAMIERDGANG